MKSTVLASCIILCSVLISSCGSPEPLPTPGVADVEFPVGRFGGGMGVEFMFFENGTFEQYFEPTGDEVHDGGTYSVEGDQITFVNTRGHCVGEEGGLYSWTFDGTTLRFTTLRDLCSNRKEMQGNYSWDMIDGD